MIRTKANTQELWIHEDITWLLTHGITESREVAADRNKAAVDELLFCQEEIDYHGGTCECSNCDRHRKAHAAFNSSQRDLNRFDGNTPYLFGNTKPQSAKEIADTLDALLKAGVAAIDLHNKQP